jgi:UDP-N-acetylglucosamine acyltransferase
MGIHPRAIVHPKAKIAEDVEIGPSSVIGENVEIERGNKIGSSVVIEGWTQIGPDNTFSPGVIIGTPPQDVKYKNQRSYVKIGRGNIFREFVTVNRATDEEGVTQIGDNNFFLAYTHIAHNCRIGNNVVMVNYAGLSGFVEVEDRAFLSGYVGVHQFVRIGQLSMIGGQSKITKDVLPYFLVDGNPARVRGLNTVGLKRAGINAFKELKQAYQLLFEKGLNISQAVREIENTLPQTPEIKYLLKFIRSSQRGVICSE